MSRRYNYPLLFLLALLLGAGIGYNLHLNRHAATTAGDVLQIISKHYADTADVQGLERIALRGILSQLNGASVITGPSSGTDRSAPEVIMVTAGAGTAYIKLSSLSKGTYAAFARKLEAARSAGMSRLTLDLRGVKGSAFDEAIEIADEFLAGDKQIASVKRAHGAVKVYRAKRAGLFEAGALTVLADSITGGAGKLICAALRDWKRAQITGSPITDTAIEIKKLPVGGQYELMLPTGRFYAPLGEKL
ncbi:S41 family peptidase [Niabella drilacis]|nr:S41 family peptidase [Niabella drilacis]